MTGAAAGLEQMRHNEAAIERLHQMGQSVRTQAAPWWARERDWAAEGILDVWVGLYARNLVDNRERILTGRTIGPLFGTAAGQVPVAVVGAGPSLDKNADQLADFPGLVVACDRAARPLAARKIPVDLVVAVDPRPALIADFLDYPGAERHALVACALLNPDAVARWRGTILWAATHHEGTQFFDQVMPALIPGIPGLHALGNVGNTAVELAIGLGASEVVLVGQDYAYTGGRMHCDDYRMQPVRGPMGEAYDLWLRQHKSAADFAEAMERRTGKVTVDGEVTYEHYAGYRETLKRLVEVNAARVVNATEGGILNDYPQTTLAGYNAAHPIDKAILGLARARLSAAIGREHLCP